jgi:saccharopine dehydrogenase-like NADP-dependent oxidoreductase
MKSILIIGAGRSSSAAIQYLLKASETYDWRVTVADADLELAKSKIDDHPNGNAVWLDAMKTNDRRELIARADVVVSLLPPFLHNAVAYDCLSLEKHLVTASYNTEELYRLDDEVREKGLIFMGEIGLDPGIDHMSAMKAIHQIRENGGKITAFRSYTGGLIAPESDNNPWHYKFTWNPRNVVLAGQGVAQYLDEGQYAYIPYNRLFSSYKVISIPGLGAYEVYPNRDALSYRKKYGIEGIPNIIRGTIRNVGFCRAWDALVRIGLTEANHPITDSHLLTYRELLEGFMKRVKGKNLKEKVATFLGIDMDDEVLYRLEWLGIFSDKKVELENATPALILEQLLLEKWALQPDDKDMIIMQHEFDYVADKLNKRLISTMVVKGGDAKNTAMARLVGLPLAIFVKLIMLGKASSNGIDIPVSPEVYEPVLEELESLGVVFEEKEILL